jgi:hypothetical protein
MPASTFLESTTYSTRIHLGAFVWMHWQCSAVLSRLREQEYGGLQRTGSLLRAGVYRRAYNKPPRPRGRARIKPQASKWPKKEKAKLNAKNAYSPRSPNDYPADGLSTRMVLKAIQKPMMSEAQSENYHLESGVTSCLYGGTAKELSPSRFAIILRYQIHMQLMR